MSIKSKNNSKFEIHISTIDTTVVYTTVVYATDTTVVPAYYGHDRRVYSRNPL